MNGGEKMATNNKNEGGRQAEAVLSWAKVAAIVIPIIMSAGAVIWKLGAESNAMEQRFLALERRADASAAMWEHYSPIDKMFVGAANGIRKAQDNIDLLAQELRREVARVDRNHAVNEQLFRSIDSRLSNIEKGLSRP